MAVRRSAHLGRTVVSIFTHTSRSPCTGYGREVAPRLRITPSMDMTVGFIGLGIMGSRMAANLRAHGYDLIVFNRTRDSAEPLLRAGAKWGSSPTVVARQVDPLFT